MNTKYLPSFWSTCVYFRGTLTSRTLVLCWANNAVKKFAEWANVDEDERWRRWQGANVVQIAIHKLPLPYSVESEMCSIFIRLYRGSCRQVQKNSTIFPSSAQFEQTCRHKSDSGTFQLKFFLRRHPFSRSTCNSRIYFLYQKRRAEAKVKFKLPAHFSRPSFTVV